MPSTAPFVILGASAQAFGVDESYDRAIDELCDILNVHGVMVTNGAFLYDRLAAATEPRRWFKFASTTKT